MNHETRDELPVWLSRLLLLAGAIGLFLLLVARSEGLPDSVRSQVLAHPVIWGTGSLLLVVAGLRTMWQGSHLQTDWKPSVSGKRFNSVVLYTRPDCPLCEEAEEILATYRSWLPPVVDVNIEDDPELLARFHETIPVVECDGRIRFQGFVNETLLRRLIEGTSPGKTCRGRHCGRC